MNYKLNLIQIEIKNTASVLLMTIQFKYWTNLIPLQKTIIIPSKSKRRSDLTQRLKSNRQEVKLFYGKLEREFQA